MPHVETVSTVLLRERFIAILRLSDHANVVEISTILCDAGIHFLEITVEQPGGFAALERVVNTLGERAIIGAGTVLSPQDVVRAADAGARFIVSPNTNPAVIAQTHDLELLSLPGALTPTEVATAAGAGSRFVKLFPGSVGGPDYLKALRGPFPTIQFIPTGGVSIENVQSWFNAGAVAVAIGSHLVPSSGALDGLVTRANQVIAAIARST